MKTKFWQGDGADLGSLHQPQHQESHLQAIHRRGASAGAGPRPHPPGDHRHHGVQDGRLLPAGADGHASSRSFSARAGRVFPYKRRIHAAAG